MVDISARLPAGTGASSDIRRPWWTKVSGRHLFTAVVALAAGLLNVAALARAEAGVPVLTAVQDLAAGRALSTGDVEPVTVRVGGDILRRLVPADEFDSGRGYVLRHPLRRGEPVRWSDLRAPGSADGGRAMSLPVATEHAVSGALRPGDLIDVAVVRGGAASWVLTGTEVLAVDQPDGGLTVLTVSVDPDDALRLALALHDGEIEVVRASGAPPSEGDRP